MATKLSETQQRAFNRLRKDGGWLSAFKLQVSMATMDSLGRKGLVKSRGHGKPGSFWSPQTVIEFKVK